MACRLLLPSRQAAELTGGFDAPAIEENIALAFLHACRSGKRDPVCQFLAQGVSPDTCDSEGLTGLLWASRTGSIEIAEALLHVGADINARDNSGRTALHHAVGYRQREFIVFAARIGALLNLVDRYGCTALDLATVAEDLESVKLLEWLGAQRVRTESRRDGSKLESR
jgi:ankyrin repeat protein